MKRIGAVLAVLVLALGSAACGGGDDDGGDGPAATGGEAIFTEHCGSCHTLEAAGTSGTIGPDLDDAQPSQETVEEQVRNGGGGMPAFEGQLTDAEIQSVSEYVASSAAG